MYKSLLVLDHLLKNGPQVVVNELQGNVDTIDKLRDGFIYVDAKGKDHGLNVRHRAKELGALIRDPERIHAEREKASRMHNVAADGTTSEGSYRRAPAPGANAPGARHAAGSPRRCDPSSPAASARPVGPGRPRAVSAPSRPLASTQAAWSPRRRPTR